MDYNFITKCNYEKIISLKNLKIITMPQEMYELMCRWLGAYEIGNKIRLEELKRKIELIGLKEYQKNARLKEL